MPERQHRQNYQIHLVHSDLTLCQSLAMWLVQRGFCPPSYATQIDPLLPAHLYIVESIQTPFISDQLAYLQWGLSDPAQCFEWPGDEAEALVKIEWHRQEYERKQLVESERFFHILFESMSDVFQILNPNGKPRYISPSLTRITGFLPEDLMNATAREIAHPDDLMTLAQALKRSSQQPGEAIRFEMRHRHRDGGYVSVEVALQNLMHLPEIAGYVVLGRELDPRNEAELLIQQNEQRYRIVAEQTGQMLYDWDVLTGQIYWAGAIEQITAWDNQSYQQVNIERWEALIHAEDRLSAMNALKKAEQEDGRYSIEYRLERRDGSYVWVEDNGIFLYDQNKVVYRMLGSMKNITERRENSLRIQRALTERGILLQEIHHRVKNNFQVILSLLNLQLRKVKHPVAREQLLEGRDRIRSMALVHDRLYEFNDVAAINGADYLRQLAQDLYTGFSPDILFVELRFQLASVRLPVEQAIPCGLLVNELLTNAFKYAFPQAQDNAWVQLSLFQEQEMIHLHIADNGCGLPPQLDLAQSSSLGLHLVGHLVRQLEGQYRLSSDKCTQWEIQFPILSSLSPMSEFDAGI